jgi:hypothetical protein
MYLCGNITAGVSESCVSRKLKGFDFLSCFHVSHQAAWVWRAASTNLTAKAQQLLGLKIVGVFAF